MSQTEACTCTDLSAPALQPVYCPTVGRDTSGNFSLSYKGMAVRTDCNRFVAFKAKKDHPEDVCLFDMTGLTLPGCDCLVYRVPVTYKQIKPGNFILISDCPFEVLYVTEVSGSTGGSDCDGPLKGITASGEVRTVFLPAQLGDCARYTRIFSVLDALGLKPGEMSENEIAFVAAVLCCPPGCRSSSGDFLSALVAEDLSKSLLHGRRLRLLIALQQSQCLETLILTRALEGELDPVDEPDHGSSSGSTSTSTSSGSTSASTPAATSPALAHGDVKSHRENK